MAGTGHGVGRAGRGQMVDSSGLVQLLLLLLLLNAGLALF